MIKKISVGLISLGCAKNLVDSEVTLGYVRAGGFVIEEDYSACDVIIVNTCSFIKEASEESVDTLLQVCRLKEEGKLKAVIAAGCLPQRFSKVLSEELKEVDGFLGVGEHKKIVGLIQKTVEPYFHPRGGSKVAVKVEREVLSPLHYTYIKISEGCDNRCSYCVIPDVRGGYRSRRMGDIVEEAKLCPERGVAELNLIGQDTTFYGRDIYGGPRLTALLKKLVKLKLFKWIRLLYTHPAHWTDELMDFIADNEEVCRYIDLPLQHISDKILKKMKRGIDGAGIVALIEKLRNKIPRLAIRTTFIVGFPGETEKDFKKLADFVQQMRFERLGVFRYSKEEGTPAFKFPGQVSERIKDERFAALMELQQGVSEEVNQRWLGKRMDVLVEARKEDNLFIGRSQFDAPEVDGSVYVRTAHAPIGSIIPVRITDTYEYDLVGEKI